MKGGGVSCSCRPWQLFSCDALKGDGVEEAGEHRKKEARSGSPRGPGQAIKWLAENMTK